MVFFIHSTGLSPLLGALRRIQGLISLAAKRDVFVLFHFQIEEGVVINSLFKELSHISVAVALSHAVHTHAFGLCCLCVIISRGKSFRIKGKWKGIEHLKESSQIRIFTLFVLPYFSWAVYKESTCSETNLGIRT